MRNPKVFLMIGAIALAVIFGPRFWFWHYNTMLRLGVIVETYEQTDNRTDNN